jgi:acyl-CoA hydrolase
VCIKVTEAVLTYVAVDNQGKPRVVPQTEWFFMNPDL